MCKHCSLQGGFDKSIFLKKIFLTRMKVFKRYLVEVLFLLTVDNHSEGT